MIVENEILFDAFTPLNVVTGAIGRYRGANLGTMLLIAVGLEMAENVLMHYYGDLMPGHTQGPTRNMVTGLAATAVGWGMTDAGLRGAFHRVL